MRYYGDYLIGVWRCECSFRIFPLTLYLFRKEIRWLKKGDREIPICPKCNKMLIYDEEV